MDFPVNEELDCITFTEMNDDGEENFGILLKHGGRSCEMFLTIWFSYFRVDGVLRPLYMWFMQRVYESNFVGRRSIVKERFSKKYRHLSLDSKLTLERLNAEARCTTKARRLGVCMPALYAVDHHFHTLTFEYVVGSSVKEMLLGFGSHGVEGELLIEDRETQIGQAIGKLHDVGLVHGDLTTSNMIVQKGIDQLMDKILSAYRKSSKQWCATLNKLAQVRQRGRKRTTVELHVVYDTLVPSHASFFF